MALDYEKRAAALFASANKATAVGLKALIAEHAAQGCLQSGITAKRSLTIYRDETSKALQQSLDEMAAQIDHRGKAWTDACASIGRALDTHLEGAQQILQKPLNMAGATGETAAAREVRGRLNRIAGELREQLEEFREGWTAPAPKPWKERHPNWDRLIFLSIGAVIAAALSWAIGG